MHLLNLSGVEMGHWLGIGRNWMLSLSGSKRSGWSLRGRVLNIIDKIIGKTEVCC